MNATMYALLCAPLLATGLAAQRPVQEPNQPNVSSRRPVDVSVEGLGEAARRAPGETTPGSSIGLSVRRSPGGLDTPLDCLESIADQATDGCLTASSTPTLGMLYPYPGLNNVFVPPAFVGGGEDNQATGSGSTIGGGKHNRASGAYATVAGGGDTFPGAGNMASGLSATVAGGINNWASGGASTIGGGVNNRAPGSRATIVGGGSNVADGAFHATVGGGQLNESSYHYATVVGGQSNTADGRASTVVGGRVNFASNYAAAVGGGNLNYATGVLATIGGGRLNRASGRLAEVAGGYNNTASGNFATVVGGHANTASGVYSTIAGGNQNSADGAYSFAAGRRARAEHTGAFVWGDSRDFDKTSSAPDQFNVYCAGGARFFSDSAAVAGVLLAPGGGSWSSVSDRDAKENVEPVDARAILDKVAVLPLATWNYKDQNDSIRHMGPMAQDFYAAFGLGLGDKTIDTIDPNGVALAAIQGLNELVKANEQRLAEKDAQIEELLAANEALRTRMERLEELAQAAMAK